MAIPALPQPAGQADQATADVAGPGGRSLRDQFLSLPSDVRDNVLDKYRDINTSHDWWESTYEEFKEQMQEVGLDIDQMYFSGFWSQGDGACFEGRVSDWTKFLHSLGYKDEVLIDHADQHWTFASVHSGHYYHQNCTAFTCDLPLPEHGEDQDFVDNYITAKSELEAAVKLAVLNQYTDREAEFTEAFRDHMRELYKQLEQEYDYLTTDEAVLEALVDCDLLEDIINEMEEAYA